MISQFMPFCREEGAPILNRTELSSLRRYFVQLKMLFTCCGITDNLEKKMHATPYLECDLADQWEALREFSEETKTYADFKACLFDNYNLNIPPYTLFDLEKVVSDQFHGGFPTLQALSEFHLQFNTILSHLLKYGLLSPHKQSQMYLQAFNTFFQPRIDFCLQIQYPNYHP
jgi:hypothetical protein